MVQYEKNGDGRRAQSLLSHASSQRTENRPIVGGSLLNTAPKEDFGDAASRHRLARSRREAAKSPLMSALSKPAAVRQEDETAAVPADPSIADEGISRPAATRGLRSMLRDSLFGREVPKNAPMDAPAAVADPSPRQERPRGPSIPNAEQSPRAQVGALPPFAAIPAPRDTAAWRPLIDPLKVISGIANSKMLIVTLTLAGAILGVVVALSTPKKYESVAEMLVDPRDLRLTDREITTAGLPSDATLAIVENQVRVLTSGTVLNRVVDELNLTSDPEFNGDAESGLFSTLTNWRALFQRGGGDDGGVRRRALTIDNLARSLNVERGGKTFVVSVGVTTESPEKSALIANTMTRVFLETYGKFQSDTAGRAADELNSRLDELRREVEEAERKVETFKAENDLIGSQGRLISEDELVTLNTQLSVARARTLELNAKAASARAVTAEAALSGALPEELASNVMTELRSQYAALRSEADRLSARLGPRHPQRQAIEAQLDGARAQIEGELRRIVSSIQVELRRAVQLEQELASRLAQLKVGQGDVNVDLVTLRELEREASAKRAVYESFLLRAKETGEQRDINAANISVISQAFPPIVSVGPSRAITVLTFMVAGFIGGVGIGGARGAWRSLRDDARSRSRTDSFGDMGDPAPEPTDGGPDAGPRGGLRERVERDEGPLRRTPERPLQSSATAQDNSAPQEGEAMETRGSSWLGAFRKKLRQEESAAVPAVPSAPGEPLPQGAVGAKPLQATSMPHATHAATWYPAQPVPSPQPPHAWQAAAKVPQQPIQAFPQPVSGFPQRVPQFAQPGHAYPVAAGPYPQPMAFYSPAVPVSFAPPAPQPTPAFVAQPPFGPTAGPVYVAPQPMVVVGHFPAQPVYPHPAHSAVAQASLMPQQAAPVAQPTPVHSSRWDEDHFSDERESRDRGPSARTVEELRRDLREFREAVLDLAESRARRRYA